MESSNDSTTRRPECPEDFPELAPPPRSIKETQGELLTRSPA
jgi:hypothetical protein